MAKENGWTKSILDSIGNTPMIELDLEHENETWHFFAKLEFMNPTGSVKDRIAKYIVEKAEKRGELKLDSIIVEATSGNTGIGLSMVAAVKGYRLIIVMPEHMSLERRKIMSNLGAEICLTPVEESFAGSRARTEKIASRDLRVFLPVSSKIRIIRNVITRLPVKRLLNKSAEGKSMVLSLVLAPVEL